LLRRDDHGANESKWLVEKGKPCTLRNLGIVLPQESDGKRVENKVPIELVKDLPDKENAWAEIERLHLHIKQMDLKRGETFGDLAQHSADHELIDHTKSIHPKANTTVRC
jgi:hypothetical protein